MNIKLLIKTSEQYLADNSPVILAGTAIAGTIATAYLAAKGGIQAGQKMDDESDRRHTEADIAHRAGEGTGAYRFTKNEKIKLVWTEFLPAAGAASITIASVVCANRISAKRIAAMAAAYSLGESKFEEYKDKVAEKFGREAHEDIKEDIVRDKIATTGSTIVLGDGEQLCFDAYSGRYFRSTMNAIEKAANQVNQLVFKENYQTLDDFWDLVGLEATAYAVENGWNADNLLEVEFSTMITPDDKPALVVKYDAVPIRGWNH